MTTDKTTKKKGKNRHTNKPISLLEFRAWLEGVEEVQAPDWTPTPEQWKLIRNRINNIQIMNNNSISTGNGTPGIGQLAAENDNHNMGFYNHPVSPAFVPQFSVAQDSSLDSTQPLPLIPPSPLVAPGGTPPTIRTPNIDTSGGQYNSAFS